MADISVNIYKVDVRSGLKYAEKEKIKTRLRIMQKEMLHLDESMRQIQRALDANSDDALRSAVTNSRNWALSVLMSHAFVQGLLRKGAKPFSVNNSNGFFVEMLAQRAVKAGWEEGELGSEAK
jgi:hypothetical protein